MHLETPDEKAVETPITGVVRRAAAVAFMALLAGYLIFNRSFASVGYPPYYVGELVLGLALFASLFDFNAVFIEPLKRSRAMVCVAVFMFYGVARVAVDAPSWGLDAARDGVICLYAIAAFLGPWLLSFGKQRSFAPIVVRNFLLWGSLAAAMWAFAIQSGRVAAPRDVKVDFLTLAAAIASCCWMVACIERAFPLTPVAIRRVAKFVFSMVVFGNVQLLVFMLPTRALWFSPLVALTILMLSTRFKVTVLIALVILVPGACFLGMQTLGSAHRPVHSTIEKIEALADPDDAHFKTLEGQRGAHSVKWRIVFWQRCVSHTLKQVPVLGLGFGTNLTDLLRDTPDWPMFADSQNLAMYGSVNRHPHSAHVTVFARLGLLGAVIWIALLGSVFWSGLTTCWGEQGTNRFWAETTVLSVWSIYLLAMSFGVVLENPFGGIWFWTLTGVIANRGTTRLSST